MYDGYWDDYYDISYNRTKDCIHTIYRISINGKVLKKGRHAHKQVAKKYLDIKENPASALKAAGYTVESRKWNETKKEYVTEYKVH